MNSTIEAFLQTFGFDCGPKIHCGGTVSEKLWCEMLRRATDAVYAITKAGECWLYPKVDKNGYGSTSILHKQVTASRLVLCCATRKPLDYHNEQGEFMQAGHDTSVCQYRNCINPEHLLWETASENSRRRERDAVHR